MTSFQEIQLIAVVVAVACALPGVFLVLRQLALLSDAIGHSVLLGIVLAFLYTRTLDSPLLLLGAALTGVLTVSLVELLQRSGRVREDAAIGLVFPALFSLAVILIHGYVRGSHLDTDAVLLGELGFAPFKRVEFTSFSVPYSLAIMSPILLLNLGFILLLYKELKLSTFDSALAVALGFSPGLLHYGLMTLVSITAVGAFEAVGSILVVALMVGPPASALLLSHRLSEVLFFSAGFSIVSAISGCWLAHWLDASYAGAMATTTGVSFLATFLLAPERGLIAQGMRRRNQRADFARSMLVIHLLNHEGRPEAEDESRLDRLPHHLRWRPGYLDQTVRAAVRRGLVERHAGLLVLTDIGRARARQALIQ